MISGKEDLLKFSPEFKVWLYDRGFKEEQSQTEVFDLLTKIESSSKFGTTLVSVNDVLKLNDLRIFLALVKLEADNIVHYDTWVGLSITSQTDRTVSVPFLWKGKQYKINFYSILKGFLWIIPLLLFLSIDPAQPKLEIRYEFLASMLGVSAFILATLFFFLEFLPRRLKMNALVKLKDTDPLLYKRITKALHRKKSRLHLNGISIDKDKVSAVATIDKQRKLFGQKDVEAEVKLELKKFLLTISANGQ